MSDGFASTTLNGCEQVSTSRQRSVEFYQYSSELISQASVFKLPKVSLIECGVAGTVELKTVSQLKNKDQHSFNANVRDIYTDLVSDVPDDTFGVVLRYTRLFQPTATTALTTVN